MRVSIVTISFNQAAYLERTLRSVLTQSYPDIEYIVVDPGSTDGSRDIIKRYQDRLAAVVLEEDSGPPEGLNRGFSLASGEIFAYLNSDDVLLSDAVANAVRVFREHPGADVVYGHGYVIDEDDVILRPFHSRHFTLWRYAYDAADVMQPATFIRRSAFEAAGGFNPDNRVMWDAELLIDLARAGSRFVRVDEYWALFRLHKASISGSGGGEPDPKRAAREGRFASAIQENRERLFEKAIGRQRRPSDRLVRTSARLIGWATDPAHVAIRLRDVAAGSAFLRRRGRTA
jgi:glycosyltransferase involved in cell wall biosynthesis